MRAAALLALAALLPAVAGAAEPLPVPASWPVGDAYLRASEAALPGYSYRDVLADPRLVALVDAGLAHNQDVALALANIAAAQAQYRIQRASLFPQIDAGASYTRAGGQGTMLGGATTKGDYFSAQGSLASYELDLFGRVQSLTRQQRDKYLATEAALRATRLTLVASIADAWLAYGADASMLKLAQDTAAAARASVDLTTRRVAGGIAPLSDQREAELTLHTAQADVSAETTALAQDLEALRLLVGADIAPETLPASIEDAGAKLTEVPAGLDSTILLRRPDVIEADYTLRAGTAGIAAARAALFPKITLTGVLGVASTALSSLFTGGAFAWGAGPAISWPIFNGGASKANLKLSEAQAAAALASWRKAVQSAFADVADTLARRGTIEAQLADVRAAREAAADNYRLADLRYRGGIASYLDALTAQQALYTSEKTLVAARLARADNLVGLYRALGGDAPGEPPAR